MKRVAHLLVFSLLVMASVARVALADDSSQAVMLVATDALEGTPFEQTVIVAAPLPNRSCRSYSTPAGTSYQSPIASHPSSAFGTFSPRRGEKGLDAESLRPA